VSERLRRTVHDHVGLTEQLVKGPGGLEPGFAHRVGGFSRGAVQPKAIPEHHVRAPVRHDIRHAFERHVGLLDNGCGHALPDHSIAVDGDANLLRVCHGEPHFQTISSEEAISLPHCHHQHAKSELCGFAPLRHANATSSDART
jgi:hypothetical protein